MRTGIFFYYQKGERLRDFPEALKGILEQENVFLYDAFYPLKPLSSFELEPISSELLFRVHYPKMIEEVKLTGNFEGALFSATGTVRAAEKICTGEIDNAFVFTGYGDHHAGRNFFGGGCYLNGAAIAIQELRNRFGVKRFAIIDTDAHHGDGTWEIFGTDPDVLYVCFCGNPNWNENNKVDIHVPDRVTDDIYLEMVKKTLKPQLRRFQPEVLFWNWGYDGTKGEYGDIGLSLDFHILMCKELKKIADEICQGRFIIVLCGGSQRDLATYLIPRIIRILAVD